MRILILLLAGLFLSSCANFPVSRHPASGYSGYSNSIPGEVSLADLSNRETRGIASVPSPHKTNPRDPNYLSSIKEPTSKALAMLIENNDISIGMDMRSVRESWGVPDQIYVTGEERHLNQIWRYSVPIQTSNDYVIEERIVNFQNGKVVGWRNR